MTAFSHEWQAAFELEFKDGHEYGFRTGSIVTPYECDEAEIEERVTTILLDEAIEGDVVKNVHVRLVACSEIEID